MNTLEISNKVAIKKLATEFYDCFEQSGSVYVFGNGGVASGCDHFAAELNKTFITKRNRPKFIESYDSNLEFGYPVLSLCSNNALITAIGNDIGFDYIFAQQLYVWGKANDLAVGITTSGQSANVLKGLETAKALGLKTILIGNQTIDQLKGVDILLKTNSEDTATGQEQILNFMHKLCLEFEDEKRREYV